MVPMIKIRINQRSKISGTKQQILKLEHLIIHAKINNLPNCYFCQEITTTKKNIDFN